MGWAVPKGKDPRMENEPQMSHAEVKTSAPFQAVPLDLDQKPLFLLLKPPGAEISQLAWNQLLNYQHVSRLNKIFTGMLFGSLQFYLFSWFCLRLIRNGERVRDTQKRL